MKKNIENSAAYIRITTRLAALSTGKRNTDSGTRGASDTLASTNANALSNTTASASGTRTCVDPHPSVSVRTIP